MKMKYQDKYEQLGTNIMLLRRDAKITQEQLAEFAGISRNHISRIEVGSGGASLDVIFALAEYFKIEPKKLFEFRD